MKNIAIALVVILLLLTGIGLTFLRHRPFAYSGVVEAVEIDVSSRLNDVITKLYIDDGSPVKQGDILADLECSQTNLQYDIAKREYERAAELLKTSAGSKENYDLKKHQYDMAAVAKTWCRIESPIDGRVLFKYYEQFGFIAAGRRLATITDISRVNAWVYVEHNLIARLKIGQKVKGCLPETGQCFEGHIIAINDEAEFTPKNVQTQRERERLVFGVKTRFENDAAQTLKPGMTVEVEF